MLKINAPWQLEVRDGVIDGTSWKYSPSASIKDGKGKWTGIEIHLPSVGYSGTKLDRIQRDQLASALTLFPNLLDAMKEIIEYWDCGDDKRNLESAIESGRAIVQQMEG